MEGNERFLILVLVPCRYAAPFYIRAEQVV